MAGADFTIADVLAWARTKPAGEEYDFCNSSRCAVAQFGLETNRPYLVHIGELGEDYPELQQAANPFSKTGRDLDRCDMTFGGFAARLEALIPAVSDEWTKLDAYLTDIEQVSA